MLLSEVSLLSAEAKLLETPFLASSIPCCLVFSSEKRSFAVLIISLILEIRFLTKYGSSFYLTTIIKKTIKKDATK